MFSKKATKMEEISTLDLTICSNPHPGDFVNFCSLLRKHELYRPRNAQNLIVRVYLRTLIQEPWCFLTKTQHVYDLFMLLDFDCELPTRCPRLKKNIYLDFL